MPLVVAGRPIQIGREIAKGAEGAVHELPNLPGRLAKLYHLGPDLARARKLHAMASMRAAARPAGAAWPVAVVQDGARVVGFIMPRFENRRELHALCAPAERKKSFPHADYRFLIATAANLARAFATVHAAGAVIGDVNERLALVDKQATVGLVDCDSYQIEVDGALLTCDVGVEQYQPPELQGITLRGLERSRNHDCFGLAVLIFQLLFFNRHPFAGVPVHGDPPSLGEAISQYRFAWSAKASARGVLQPPNTLAFAALDERLRNYFERAFGPEGRSDGRPSASAWVAALDDFAQRLVACPANPQHAHLPGPCPICIIEGRTGAQMFTPRGSVAAPDIPDFGALAARLRGELKRRSVPASPGPAPADRDHAHSVTGAPPPPGLHPPSFFGRLLKAVGIGDDPWGKELARRNTDLRNATLAYDAALTQWKDPLHRDKIANLVRDLHTQCDRLGKLPKEAAGVISGAISQARSASLRAWLETFPVASASIEGIGRGRIAALEGAGIDTAADVTSHTLKSVPGFGPVLSQRLLDWRKACEAGFTAAPTVAMPPSAVTALATVRAKGSSLDAAIRDGLGKLDRMIEDETARLSGVRLQLERLARCLAQARADRARMS
jgi:DNA-binding helix-hairpin-helix protein with protein kinase domain